MSIVWNHRSEFASDKFDLTGYDAEASDGHIGKIDEASNATDDAHIVVDTGFWIFGKKRLVPAGAIERIDEGANTVYLSMTKDQIKDSPDWREDWRETHDFRTGLEAYYGPYIPPR